MRDLAVSGGKLVPATDVLREKLMKTSQGSGEIGGDFDFYILCSLALHVKDAYPEREREPLLDALKDKFRDKLAMRTLAKLRQCTTAPVIVLPSPCQPRQFATQFEDVPLEEAHRLADTFETACRQLAAEQGAILLPQPKPTLAPNRITTRMKYAPSRKIKRPKEDRWHVNPDYGEIALRAALKRGLRAVSRETARPGGR
jgi:hypothetical protein